MKNEVMKTTEGGAVALNSQFRYRAADIIEQVKLVQEVMAGVMTEGEHYGVIPGTGNRGDGKPPKKSLLKPGAEILSTTFRLAPYYDITERELDRSHREYRLICTLKHILTGEVWGQGVGVCSTMESKYRYRGASAPDEITDTPVPKDYWDRKNKGAGPAELRNLLEATMGVKGNFGTKKVDSVWVITKRGERLDEKVENPDIADVYNTVLKMAKKRAHIDAVLTCTACSDMFTQDLEDIAENAAAAAGRAAPVDVAYEDITPQTPLEEQLQASLNAGPQPAPASKPAGTKPRAAAKPKTSSMPDVSNASKAKLWAIVSEFGMDGEKRVVLGHEDKVSTIVVNKTNADVVTAIACKVYDDPNGGPRFIVPRELNQEQIDTMITYLEAAQAGHDMAGKFS